MQKPKTQNTKTRSPVKDDTDEINFEGDVDFSEEITNKDKNNKEIVNHTVQDEDKEKSLEEADLKSIYIKNVDFSTTPEELEEHFKKSGEINRITILCDKYTGVPKG